MRQTLGAALTAGREEAERNAKNQVAAGETPRLVFAAATGEELKGAPVILSQNELEAIINGSWTIDCPVMSLIPACTGRESYQGVGYIEQAEGYELRFKLISGQKTDLSFTPEPTQAGQLYASEEYWTLVAKDVHGREWTSERILPDLLHDEGSVATGSLQDLSSAETFDLGEQSHSICLWLLGEFKVTFNQAKMTTTTVGGEDVGLSGEWNHGKFRIAQKDFFVRRERSWLFLEAKDPVHRFQPFYADRIEESLEFALGRPARATLLLKRENDRFLLQVKSVPPALRDGYAKPPFPPPIKDKEAHFWRLFDLHLSYVEGHELGSRSPLARAWQYFIGSRSSALEVRALALGVGLEALLKILYPITESRISSFQLDAARKIISEAELSESIRNRLFGAIDSMRQMSASDRLHQLVERGVISRDQFKAWKRIRNRAAHAGDFSIDDETIRDCNLVLTAAHRIAFDALGYEGRYKDYGTVGWPESTYPAEVEEG